MYNEIDFFNLSIEEKINICNKTQGVLKSFFPDSEFTITKANLESGLAFYKKLIDEFKGKCIVDNTAVVFFKKVEITSPFDKIGEFRRVRKTAHDTRGNCMFIDFLVADFNKGNLEELKEFFFRDPAIEYFMMLRRGEVILKTRRDLETLAKRVSTYSLISHLAS